jgi:predicted double-glycine peptidase
MTTPDLWISAAAAFPAAGLAALATRAMAGWRRPWWTTGYLLPLVLVVIYAVGVRRPDLALSPWLSWSMLGFWRKLLLAAGVGGLTAALVARLGRPRERRALAIFGAVVIAQSCVWPAIAAARLRTSLAALPERVDPQGVCRQQTDFTCGPAAAVTALNVLGVHATEGDLALLAGSSETTGTPADILASVLNRRYAGDGVRATLRRFSNADQLASTAPTLALLSYAIGVDHWVCVFDVGPYSVLVADPMGGLSPMSRIEFETRWRRVGIVVERSLQASGRPAWRPTWPEAG